MIAPGLMPGWVAGAARFNPVDWAAVASRSALAADPDWALILGRVGLLLAFTVLPALLATRAFRAYQRSC